jgi:hypothetical protein
MAIAMFVALETLIRDTEELAAVCGPLLLRSAASEVDAPMVLRRGSAEEAAVDAESLFEPGRGTMV